jgi:flavin-dependent dehydrogenase
VFRSRFVVGADGAHSIVAKEAGLQGDFNYIAGINTVVTLPDEELSKWKSKIIVDVGCVPSGYAWVFPKHDHLAIGIACLSTAAKGLRQRYHDFLNSLNLDQYTVKEWSGGLIPVCKKEPALVKERIALVGDAAGLVDPLTGEGIQNAVLSAKLLAPVLNDCLRYGKDRLIEYQQSVEKTIMPEIKIARVLQKVFIRFPFVVVKLLHFDRRVWRGCCLMVRGDLDYTTAKQRIGGFKGISSLLKQALAS